MSRRIYIHRKSGKQYEYLMEAQLEADPSTVMVVYRNPVTEVIWTRPLLEFLEKFYFDRLEN